MTDDATTDAMEDVEHLEPRLLIAAQADFGRWLEANGDELRAEDDDGADVIVGGAEGDMYVFDRWDAFAAWYVCVRGTTDAKAALARWWDAVPVKAGTTLLRGRRD